MKCKFQIGQKVVCVDDNWGPPRAGDPEPGHVVKLPKRGSIYTISDMGDCALIGVFLEFKEIPRGQFSYVCFRALNERPQQTDIGVFYPALKTKRLEDA